MNSHPVARTGVLLRRLKSVETRTKLQKIVHILQVMGGPFPERFDFQYRGTHSDEFAREIEAFIAEELVVETAGSVGRPSILRPTGNLLDLLELDPSLAEEPAWLAWADDLNAQSVGRLDGVSALLYFHQHRWPRAAWRKKFFEVKPQRAGDFEPCEALALQLLGGASEVLA
ncbi:hypothetical protein [Haloferula sp. A504]|uniref:hypothetical protein n=1 Tax=Haloferula sp. A504 TaxID=3373601 RepID=UPI0031C831AD|nr:hypothetical protein [Verrucomicrobiaceae bacterium E54]